VVIVIHDIKGFETEGTSLKELVDLFGEQSSYILPLLPRRERSDGYKESKTNLLYHSRKICGITNTVCSLKVATVELDTVVRTQEVMSLN
jgi:hypothetical protein